MIQTRARPLYPGLMYDASIPTFPATSLRRTYPLGHSCLATTGVRNLGLALNVESGAASIAQDGRNLISRGWVRGEIDIVI